MARLSFRCDAELVERVDAERGLIPREAWLRRAVEQALGEPIGSTHGGDNGQGRGEPGSGRGAEARSVVSPATVPAPAEQPRDEVYWRPGSSEEKLLGLGRNADSSQSKRDVRPRPKGGK